MVLDDVDPILRLVDLAAEKETRERAAVIIVVSNNRHSFLP